MRLRGLWRHNMDGLQNLGPLLSGGGGTGDFGGGGGSLDAILKSVLSGGGDTAASPNWMKALLGGLFGAGEVGNVIEERKRAQYQSLLMDLINHPEKLTAMVLKAQRPLDNSLVQSINNRVQGDLAERGLSQAPGIFAASEAQALAPFQQQNQQTALQQVLASLGLPGGTFKDPQNMTPALMAFLRSFGTGGRAKPSGGGSGSATEPSLIDIGGPDSGLSWFGDANVPSQVSA